MKMNDANVVVLRFGSQDVIATSGKLIAYADATTPLFSFASLASGEASYSAISDFAGSGVRRPLTSASSPMSLSVSFTGDVEYNNSNYFIFGDCTKNNTEYSLTVTGSAGAPSGAGYTNLSSQKDIIDWLIVNAKAVS